MKVLKQSKLYKSVCTKGLAARPEVAAHEPAMRSLYSVHSRDCLRKGLEPMHIDDYVSMTRLSCIHCGRPPWNWTKFNSKTAILYNGVDRVDNALGYVAGNCVPCCKDCNAFKNGRTTDSMIEHCRRIAAYQDTLLFPGLR